MATVAPNAFARLRLSCLCRRDLSPASARDAIGWWEARRIPFNLIVGSAGVLSCLVLFVVSIGSWVLFGIDFGVPDPPLLAVAAVLVYGIMANVCYTGGWMAELLVRKLWPSEADRFATLSFSLGLVFSVLLTLSPGIVVGAGGVFGLLKQLSLLLHKH